MPPKGAFADLGVDGGSDSEPSSSGSEGGSPRPAAKKAGAARATALDDPAPEALAALGYGGPAAPLAATVPEPPAVEPVSWAWGTARDPAGGGGAADADDDPAADRAHTAAAAAAMAGVAEAAVAARRAAADAHAEQRGRGEPLTFAQREKRKRAARGAHKNYVEEEKRVARQIGGGYD
jgi:hypothetical protein